MPTAGRVLIVGAGLAGGTAARELVRRGLTVTVVDGSPRVGARLATRRVPLNGGGEAVLNRGCRRLTATTEPFRWLRDGLCEAGTLKVWAERVRGRRRAGRGGVHVWPVGGLGGGRL